MLTAKTLSRNYNLYLTTCILNRKESGVCKGNTVSEGKKWKIIVSVYNFTWNTERYIVGTYISNSINVKI